MMVDDGNNDALLVGHLHLRYRRQDIIKVKIHDRYIVCTCCEGAVLSGVATNDGATE